MLPSNEVKIYIDDASIIGNKKKNALYYVWTNQQGKQYLFYRYEILHYKSSMTFDGIAGIAVKDALLLNIETGQYSQKYLQQLYKGNMFGGKIVLQYTGEVGKGSDNLILETERYANSVGTGKFLPLPIGVTASPLEMKLSDAEFTELK